MVKVESNEKTVTDRPQIGKFWTDFCTIEIIVPKKTEDIVLAEYWNICCEFLLLFMVFKNWTANYVTEYITFN